MKIDKILSVFLIIALIFSLGGCRRINGELSSSSSDIVENTDLVSKNYMTLLYSAADTFNPYTAKTGINRQFMTLLYDSLIRVNNEFEAVYSLAESVDLNEKKCVVTIKDVVFSDGSALTADDVVYSYNLAKNSDNSYRARLYEVESAKAIDRKTVEFSLNKYDQYFVNLLDFPIIKSGSDKITDSDSVVQPPIGSGRFIVSDDKNSLIVNPKYKGSNNNIKTIKLINAPDNESVSHYAQIGAPDMYYSDISDGNILRLSGTKLDVNLNNIVYIGINKNYGALKETAVRQAISSGIDRTKICRDYYYNNAIAANGFFNPAWKAVNSVQNIQIIANKEITVENLEEIGYNSLDNRGLRLNSSGDYLSFTMLVNSENRIRVAAAKSIAEQLLEYGIKITVIEKSYADYKKALEDENFQLFLGETKLTNNMDISCLVLEGGSVAYGLQKVSSDDKDDEKESEIKDKKKSNKLIETGAQRVIKGFYNGDNTIADIASVLQTEMPFIPVCYRTGILFCNDKIENIEHYSEGDIYSSIESYIINR